MIRLTCMLAAALLLAMPTSAQDSAEDPETSFVTQPGGGIRLCQGSIGCVVLPAARHQPACTKRGSKRRCTPTRSPPAVVSSVVPSNTPARCDSTGVATLVADATAD